MIPAVVSREIYFLVRSGTSRDAVMSFALVRLFLLQSPTDEATNDGGRKVTVASISNRRRRKCQRVRISTNRGKKSGRARPLVALCSRRETKPNRFFTGKLDKYKFIRISASAVVETLKKRAFCKPNYRI